VNISFLLLLCLSITCNEGRRISREKLSRLLGQNPVMGVRQADIKHKEKIPTGVNVQPAKGQMFSTLDDVARHLQSLGVKSVNNQLMFHQEKMMISPKTELQFAQG